VAIAVALGACGGSDSRDVTLTIGSRATPEERLLGNLYSEALERAGYEVVRRLGFPPEYPQIPLRAVKLGNISGYPDHLDGLLGLLRLGGGGRPKTSRQAYRLARNELRREGLTVLAPAPYSRNRQVALLRQTADRNHLEVVSDLKGKAGKMTVVGPTGCHLALDCLGGLERYYGIVFEGYSYVGLEPEEDPYRALEDGKADAAFLTNTDGRLAEEKFVLLEDDKQTLPAGNPLFVTSKKTIEQAGPDFTKAIAAVQQNLDLEVMQRMIAAVELEGEDPAEVAERYLDQVELPD
jgi:osmoprotectant transport system substrate-binding protein